MRKLAAALTVAAALVSSTPAVAGDWYPISTDPVNCQSSSLRGVVHADHIEWKSTQWTVGRPTFVDTDGLTYRTRHYLNAMWFALKMDGANRVRYDLTEVSVTKSTRKCLRLEVTATTPYNGERRVKIIEYGIDGVPGSWSMNRHVTTGDVLR